MINQILNFAGSPGYFSAGGCRYIWRTQQAKTNQKLKLFLKAGLSMSGQFPPGMHLLIDLWGASHLGEIDYIEKALNQAAMVCGATILSIHLQSIGNNSGVTGVAILADSHISIHTWPETGYVALDIFLRGNSDPHRAVPVLHKYFKPTQMKVTEAARGQEIQAI